MPTPETDLVEIVARAISHAPQIFHRTNKDNEYPFELCHRADDGEIVLLESYRYYEEACNRQIALVNETRARAAISATLLAIREPTGAIKMAVSEAIGRGELHDLKDLPVSLVLSAWRFMIDRIGK